MLFADQIAIYERRIGIGDDDVGLEMLAPRNDARRAAAGYQKLLNRRVEADIDVELPEQPYQASHDRAGPAARGVHAPLALEPVDEQVDGRGAERVAAHEQRLEGEDLPQSLVADVTC